MRRLAALALLAALAAAGDKSIVEFRLKKDPDAVMRGWLLEFDDDAFRFEPFGTSRRQKIPWDQLVAEDAHTLRLQLKLELTDDERQGLVPGQRIHFDNGQTLDGLLVEIGPDGRHWFKREGLVLPYPRERVKRVEEVKVQESEIYAPEELYLRRLDRIPPTTARQHRDLADYLVDLGRFAEARRHYEEALRLNPEWRAELEGKIETTAAIAQDAQLADVLRRARKESRLDSDYEEAKRRLLEFLDRNPDRRRAVERALDDIEALEARRLAERFHGVKNDEFSRVVRQYLTSRRPTLEEAMQWATETLPHELETSVADRLGLDAEQAREMFKTESKNAPHWASYGHGSFVVSKRAVRGKPTPKQIRGDPESWWDAYDDAGTRSNWLKAYAAERLPDLFEVVQVKTIDCPACGGTGKIKHMSVRELDALGGAHEWYELCRRCYGARLERQVAYR